MSVEQSMIMDPPIDAINVGTITSELERVNAQVLAMVKDAAETLADIDVRVTDVEFAAGNLLTYISEVQASPIVVDAEGTVIRDGVPGKPAHWRKLSDSEYEKLKARIALLRSLHQFFVTPRATDKPSPVQSLRASGRRWTVGQ